MMVFDGEISYHLRWNYILIPELKHLHVISDKTDSGIKADGTQKDATEEENQSGLATEAETDLVHVESDMLLEASTVEGKQ